MDKDDQAFKAIQLLAEIEATCRLLNIVLPARAYLNCKGGITYAKGPKLLDEVTQFLSEIPLVA